MGKNILAWNIVRHAFVITFGNFNDALKASIVPFAILTAMLYVAAIAVGLPISAAPLTQINQDDVPGFLKFSVIAIPLYLFMFSWVAVTWHRFILCEEYPAIIPAIKDRPILPYIKRTLWLTLQMIVVMIPISLVVGLVMVIFFGQTSDISASSPSAVFPAILMGVLFSYFWFRWGISLPAVAVGKSITSAEAWRNTKMLAPTIFGVAAILSLLNVVVSVVLTEYLSGIAAVGFVLNLMFQWVTVMVGVSILTTLYGHVIEGRPLAD